MRRFLIALACLSTLALSQNVLVGTASSAGPDSTELVVVGDQQAGIVPTTVGGEVPEPGTLALLLTGLAGLMAAGSRRDDRSEGLSV